jgi:hypothetical protein
LVISICAYWMPWSVRNGMANIVDSFRLREVQIIVDFMQMGFGLGMTKEFVNKHRNGTELKVERVGFSTAYKAYKRLKPVVEKRKQGTNDPEAVWSKARLVWVT